jgi:hypothetical protein
MKRRQRKQARKLTPPLSLRGASGERVIVEVDDQFVTSEIFQSCRLSALLTLAPGLRIEIGSRSIHKRRFPVLRISPQAWHPSGEPLGSAFAKVREEMQR